jgi:4'-phosphopantetheinyl transferase superfamily protein
MRLGSTSSGSATTQSTSSRPLCSPSPRCSTSPSPVTFFTYWTRKEALVKATGDGATVPLWEVVVAPPGTPPRLLGYPRPGGLAAQLRDLSPDPGYVGALAVLSPRPVVVRERSAEQLLTAG